MNPRISTLNSKQNPIHLGFRVTVSKHAISQRVRSTYIVECRVAILGVTTMV